MLVLVGDVVVGQVHIEVVQILTIFSHNVKLHREKKVVREREIRAEKSSCIENRTPFPSKHLLSLSFSDHSVSKWNKSVSEWISQWVGEIERNQARVKGRFHSLTLIAEQNTTEQKNGIELRVQKLP